MRYLMTTFALACPLAAVVSACLAATTGDMTALVTACLAGLAGPAYGFAAGAEWTEHARKGA